MIAGITQQQVLAQAQAKLIALRDAIAACADYYAWLSANSLGDLEAIGFSANDAQAMMNAFADANTLATVYHGSATQSQANYNYSASQRIIIGPQ